jgi:hypothetical protein
MYARYSSGQRNALRQIALQTNATFDRTITWLPVEVDEISAQLYKSISILLKYI